jgi:hypothetical protein
MADYYPLIAKAVAGLDKSTGEVRRALYERARTALVTQLRGVLPALSESDITRERLALEEAIRKVEAEAARKSRFDVPPERKRVDRGEISDPFKPAAPPRPPAPPPSERDDQTNPEHPLSGTAADLRRPVRTPPPEPGSLSNNGLKGFRNVVADAENLGDATAQAGRTAREAYNAVPSPSPEFDRLEPRLEPEGLRARARAPAREQRRDPPSAREPARPPPPPPNRQPPPPPPPNRQPPPREPAAREPPPREPVSRERTPSRERPPGRYIAASRDPMPDFDLPPRGEPARANEFSARDFAGGPDFDADAPREPDFDLDAATPRQRARRRAEAAAVPEPEERALPRPRGKLIAFLAIGAALLVVAGVVAWEWQPMVAALRGLASPFKTAAPTAQPPAAPSRQKINDRIGSNDSASPGPQSAADVAQRVVLYEEDPEDPGGKRYVGSAVWHTESVARGAGQPPDPLVRADITIPERKMTMKWTLQRNADKTLPASHTVEVVFTLPQDFAHGSVQNVPGVLMKETEQTRGVPLAGLAVKVTDGYFLIGLSAVDSEMQRNISLLKDRPWFDVPIVYTDGRRAILAVEKGTPGDRAFNAAFAAWKQ